jgi:hypothetical protein
MTPDGPGELPAADQMHRHQLRAAGHRPHRRLGAGYERLQPHLQPTDQFWPFQFTEAGIFVALTTATLGATVAPASRRRRHVMPVHSQRLATSPARPPRLAAMAPHRTAQINSFGMQHESAFEAPAGCINN